MPATKKKAKAKTKTKTRKTKTRKKAAPKADRHLNAYCKGECRLRTKGMRVGDVRRRVRGKRRFRVERMPDAP